MTPAEPTQSLSTIALARIRGWSRQYAHRWSTRMEKEYGPPYIIRVGPNRAIRITPEGLRKIEADKRDPAKQAERHAHEIKLLRRKLADAEKLAEGQASRIIGYGRTLRALETRVIALEKRERKHMATP